MGNGGGGSSCSLMLKGKRGKGKGGGDSMTSRYRLDRVHKPSIGKIPGAIMGGVYTTLCLSLVRTCFHPGPLDLTFGNLAPLPQTGIMGVMIRIGTLKRVYGGSGFWAGFRLSF